jgi:hypothetical protein
MGGRWGGLGGIVVIVVVVVMVVVVVVGGGDRGADRDGCMRSIQIRDMGSASRDRWKGWRLM